MDNLIPENVLSRSYKNNSNYYKYENFAEGFKEKINNFNDNFYFLDYNYNSSEIQENLKLLVDNLDKHKYDNDIVPEEEFTLKPTDTILDEN